MREIRPFFFLALAVFNKKKKINYPFVGKDVGRERDEVYGWEVGQQEYDIMCNQPTYQGQPEATRDAGKSFLQGTPPVASLGKIFINQLYPS